MQTQNATPDEVFFFKKEIERLHNEIKQYQEENLSIKKELKSTAGNQKDMNSIRDQIKEIVTCNDDTLSSKNNEILKLTEKIRDKDNQIHVLSTNLDNKKQVEDGLKAKVALFETTVQESARINIGLKQEIGKLTDAVSLKDRQIDALRTKFEEYLAITSVAPANRRSKKDTIYQGVIDLKESEIKGLTGVNDALKFKLKESLDTLSQVQSKLSIKETECQLLRKKHQEAADFCSKLADMKTNAEDAANFLKVANFCRMVAQSEVTKA
jgi:chromosome segregation ATPase